MAATTNHSTEAMKWRGRPVGIAMRGNAEDCPFNYRKILAQGLKSYSQGNHMGQQAQNEPLKMPLRALLHSLAEAGRCLGVAQEKGDKDAIAYWSAKVDELVAQGIAI